MKAALVLIGIIGILGFANPAGAAEEDIYPIAPSGYYSSDSATHLVSNMPPVKDQNGVGLCYAFASATLAEQYSCKARESECVSADDLVSPIALSEFSSRTREISSGGYPGDILSQLENGPAVRKEKCAPFPPLAKFVKRFGGWETLSKKFSAYKAREGCTTCLEKELRSYFPSNVSTLTTALKAATFEAFLWGVFVPESCKSQQLLTLPRAKKESYQLNGHDSREIAAARDKLEQLLMNDIPVVVDICTDGRGCREAHSVVVSGIREICDQNGSCLLQLKLQNSYGLSWQERMNGGWVLADRFLENATIFSWLQKPAQAFSRKTLPRSGGAGGAAVRALPADSSRGSYELSPGEDIGKFLEKCRKKGGTPAFTDSGRRCDTF